MIFAVRNHFPLFYCVLKMPVFAWKVSAGHAAKISCDFRMWRHFANFLWGKVKHSDREWNEERSGRYCTAGALSWQKATYIYSITVHQFPTDPFVTIKWWDSFRDIKLISKLKNRHWSLLRYVMCVLRNNNNNNSNNNNNNNNNNSNKNGAHSFTRCLPALTQKQ